MMKTQTKIEDTFRPYDILVRGDGYTEESVDAVIREFSSTVSSLHSAIDSLRHQLNAHSEALNESEHNNDILKHRMDSSIPQYFSSFKKLKKLAFKDRPAMVIETGDVYVYDRESKEWRKRDPVQC